MSNYKIGVEFEADGSKAVSAINQVSQAMQNMQSQVSGSSKNTQNSVDGLTSSLKKLSIAFGSFLSASALGGFIKDSLKASASLESMKISFEVFTGSARTASELMKQFKDQAIKSPMQFQDIVQGGKTLMSYGLTAQQVIPITKMLGDISGGNADRFQRLSLAFGQVNAAGRLMGQEARQMINAGFNPLQAISEKTGESMASLTKRMHDGQVSVREVGQAFIYATSEGGRFFGNAEKQSQSLQGKFNKLSETLYFTMASVGESIAKSLNLGGIIDYLSVKLNGLAESFKMVTNESGDGKSWQKLAKILIDFSDIVLRNLGDTLLNIVESLNSFFTALFNIADGIRIVSKEFSNFVKNVPLLNKIAESVSNLLGNPKQANQQSGYGKFSLKTELEFQKIKNPYDEFIKSLSNKPINVPIKVKKDNFDPIRDTILGTDYITKKEGEIIKGLIKANKDANQEIDSDFENSLEKKLSKLTQNFEEQKALYKKYGLDFNNVQAEYLVRYSQLYASIEDKKRTILTSAMDRSIAGNKNDYDTWLQKFASNGAKISQTISNSLSSDILNAPIEFGKSFYTATKDLAINISSGFAEVFGSLMSGDTMIGDAFAKLGSTMLGSLGDYLIQVGTAMTAMGLIQTVFKKLFADPFKVEGVEAIAVGMGAIAIGTALRGVASAMASGIKDKATSTVTNTAKSSSGSQMTSGASYQYGGASYATQSIRLSIDLTGAITASPTGYNINKSLETVLRVTGR